MKRGTDFAPVPVSQRILTAGFTFFVLITVSTYTANMAAFLTTKNLGKTIDSFEVRGTKPSNTFSCVKNETPLLPAKNVGMAIDLLQVRHTSTFVTTRTLVRPLFPLRPSISIT